jgi:Zn finger protein HypA/HybF involved in hydrogenase expression
MKKLSIIEFIQKANIIHHNIYDYSLTKYINSSSKVKIICSIHGIFEQTPNQHISGKQGCPKCAGKGKNIDEIINDFNIKHNYKYDYSLIEYKNKRSKIKIICPEHGIFEQISYSHLSGIGCPKCAGNKKNIDDFTKNANKIHNFKYNYELSEYKSAHKKIKIICPEHGIFVQTPNSHLRGNGCPNCKNKISKGENIIINYLKENNISFIPQHKFENCKYKKLLPFDFYLPDYNMCIEYDGSQHFKISWNNIEKFKLIQIRDKIKTDYCNNSNIKLIRIKYNDNIIEKLEKRDP